MSSVPSTSRERARPIRDRNYFKTPTRVSSRTKRLSWALVVLAAVVAVAAAWPAVGARVSTPGRVSSPHAAWENRCDACHVPGEPISGGRPGAGWFGRSMGAPAHRCETCHRGTAHFAGQAAETNDCASCHVEHRGRDAKLTRPPDSACLSCHGKQGGPHPYVTDFATDHPPFKSPEKFVRQLKFSHALHTAAGMTIAGAKQGRPPRPADFKLDCSACHQLQNGDAPGNGPAPARSDGRYYAPVRYEVHCRNCHPLNAFDPPAPGMDVPHGGSVADVKQFLNRLYAAEVVNERPNLLDFKLPAPRMDRPPPVDMTAKRALAERVARSEGVLLKSGKGCLQCHQTDVKGEIVPVVPKQVWLERAVFDHRAHRAAECRECHAGALAEPGAVLIDLEPRLVGDIEGCRRCHAPASEVNGAPRGGAGRSCTECHTYHGREPHRGPAAPHRDPEPRLNLDRFIRGTP